MEVFCAMIGVDGSFGGAQQYYSLPDYQASISSPFYIPLVQPNNFLDSYVDSSAYGSRPDGRGMVEIKSRLCCVN
ncbi:hypothetical protein TSUD_72570 [Trifolium subterraneum]|uniref:Uncharacterized protein n=1 Tax=Trifolium subterraneum TaxID=3900 RepID=A0A2Z6NBS7_TRISU|nr:hypothetical protein TSUD_72570 [Trifolium subterraneum]